MHFLCCINCCGADNCFLAVVITIRTLNAHLTDPILETCLLYWLLLHERTYFCGQVIVLQSWFPPPILPTDIIHSPRATALNTSMPARIPPSRKTGMSVWLTASTMAARTSRVAGEPSNALPNARWDRSDLCYFLLARFCCCSCCY